MAWDRMPPALYNKPHSASLGEDAIDFLLELVE